VRGWLGWLCLQAPAMACNCIARAENPRVLNAYLLITCILMLLPILTLTFLVRRIQAWE
jgi:hypothetical protein